MPSYPWLFTYKERPGADDRIVPVPAELLPQSNVKVVATEEALQLVAYLKSLKQVPLPGSQSPAFLYQKDTTSRQVRRDAVLPDGATLYASNCQMCHQQNGQGLAGAFPPLKGSPIVTKDDPSVLVEIIMKGYDAHEQYGQMPPVGTQNNLDAAEITAIINHERTSWGNEARVASQEEVESILDFIKTETKPQ
jgi:cytochrome c oxidase cbb3-type subunit 2